MIAPLNQRANSGLTLSSAKRHLIRQFREAGLATPDLDARILIMAATGLTQTDMITRGRDYPIADGLALISEYAERRLSGEPIDHILGYREFFGRRFSVSKDVLSPRPETEMLVEAALEILKDKPSAHILDLGTGSGAIVISILAEALDVHGVAIDVSELALAIARENAKKHDVEKRVTFLQGSWFEPVEGQFDIILSNPPYITDAAMEALSAEVSGFDPDLALRGGDDGLLVYKAIIADAVNYLKPDGVILFEIGYDQGEAVRKLLEQSDFNVISVSKDLSGHDRMIKATYMT